MRNNRRKGEWVFLCVVLRQTRHRPIDTNGLDCLDVGEDTAMSRQRDGSSRGSMHPWRDNRHQRESLHRSLQGTSRTSMQEQFLQREWSR